MSTLRFKTNWISNEPQPRWERYPEWDFLAEPLGGEAHERPPLGKPREDEIAGRAKDENGSGGNAAE